MRSFIRSLRYLLVFSLPLLTFVSFRSTGWFTFLPLIEAFVFIPLVELIIKPDISNVTEEEEKILKNAFIYDFWIYLASAFQFALLIYFFISMQDNGISLIDSIGRITAMGLMCGIYGINVAHELGHRPERYHHWLAKGLLLTSMYMHFFIEHNRGHHRWVSTPKDPATSRRNESVFIFWIRSIVGSYRSAWKLEQERLTKQSIHWLNWKNEMIQCHILQIGLLGLIFVVWGGLILFYFLCAAMVGILLLETVNYIEHYGLLRKKTKNDQYERVLPKHSWNSDHLLGRLFLFELSRHSDHHYLASRKYQILRHIDESPQMPTGYPGMILLSLMPPLWFYVMNRRLAQENAND